jgi:protein O-GlcNAc transferase
VHWMRDLEQELGTAEVSLHLSRTHSRLRIGYRSLGFRDCATGHLIEGLFENHDRARFEVYAYSYGPDDGSRYRRHFVETCDHFVEVGALDNAAEASRIRADSIDILVDISALVGDVRFGTLRYRPARIQVSWLGLTGTTGSKHLDYSIVDEVVVPLDSRDSFTEKLVYMPNSYLIGSDRQAVSQPLPTRTEFQLPLAGFIFCCFNQAYKINPPVFDAWMRILRRVPDSILWLLHCSDEAARNLRHEAENRGVPGQRVIFAPFLTRPQHLARLHLAGLCLDTIPVNAHTTASDALWSGVPIVTCAGQNFVSRVSASLLHAIGMSELIVENLDEYEQLAVRLVTNPRELDAIRTKLWSNRTTTPLFDTPNFVRNLERAFDHMWQLCCTGGGPQHISVRELLLVQQVATLD